ncbi:MAG: AAA family ATPase [Holosporales bacterium]|jgi:DNA polymerase-3 subunit delta'|nr:AAA family ATPase [Holosporales bacterium]
MEESTKTVPFLQPMGHEQTERCFARALERGALPPALLISGPESLGKALLARKLASALLSGKSSTSDENLTSWCTPSVAHEIHEGTHPDFLATTFSQEEASVDRVRQMLAWVYKKPLKASVKVVLLEDVELLNRNAANALLKTLEEPPPTTFILLTSSYPERLLATVRSRCVSFPLLPSSDADIRSPIQEQSTLYPKFWKALQAAEQGKLALAQEFAGEEGVWPFFSSFSLRAVHAATCGEEETLLSLSKQTLLGLWQETVDKIVQTDRLNLDKKAVMLWFFCTVSEVSAK